MKSIKLFSVIFFFTFAQNIFAEEIKVASPDNLLQVAVQDNDGKATYSALYNGAVALENSPLGFISTLGDFSKNLKIVSQKIQIVSDNYTLNRTKHSQISYMANELVCSFENAKSQHFEVIFRVSNNNIAFCYHIPKESNMANITIEKEITGFDFSENATSFLSPAPTAMTGWQGTKPSYEEEYMPNAPLDTSSKYGQGFTFPCLFHDTSLWLLISETGVTGTYCGSHLSESTEEGLFSIAFPQKMENNGVGNVAPTMSLPAQTPWRTITVADNLKPIVETTIAFDVVVQRYEPKFDYHFGKGTWSWILWKDESMNFADQKTYIDFAAKMNFEFVLIDAIWDENLGYEKMEKLLQYAKSKGIAPFLWYNSNGFWNDTPQGPKNKMNTAIARKKEMAWLQKNGVKGIKVDFFGGDKQTTMQLYEDILSDANDYGIMVIFHGATLPRGWERMYPNYVGSEAVLASENLTFNQHFCDEEAFNACLHPFIRNAVGSMEFGGVFLNQYLSRDNKTGKHRITGDIFQLATAVLFQNPVQMFALAPNNLTDAPQLCIDFVKTVPTVWDETVFIDGYPGKFVVLARRSGDKWYIAAINAEKEAKKLTLKLDFLKEKNLTKYADTEGLIASLENVKLNKKNELKIEIQPNGGVVLTSAQNPQNTDIVKKKDKPDLFVEAESFSNKGGWKIDQQFIHQMGSPYLLAHGLGKSVKNASTELIFPQKGNYRLFVRTFNWTSAWHKGAGPGKFQVLINGKPQPITFGNSDEKWLWQDGGTMEITDTKAKIELHNLTGFDGRCDALYFTLDKNFVPPNSLEELTEFRYAQIDTKPRDGGNFDLVVIGGGYGGICTAVSAARLGVKAIK